MMEITFAGKRALVTGATKGIGRDIALQLAKCGAEVVAVGRSVADLESLKGEVSSIHTIAVDLADWNATKEALKDVGQVDLLVNNAGVGMVQTLPLYTEENIDGVFDVNVKALINVTQIITEDLLNRKAPGSIVNISSLSSLCGYPRISCYSATKGAVDAFTRSAASELGPHNIRVNSVNPSMVLTDMGKDAWTSTEQNMVTAMTPLRRLCEIRDVTDAVLFLLSDKASMITGTCLPVDGGLGAA